MASLSHVRGVEGEMGFEMQPAKECSNNSTSYFAEYPQHIDSGADDTDDEEDTTISGFIKEAYGDDIKKGNNDIDSISRRCVVAVDYLTFLQGLTKFTLL